MSQNDPEVLVGRIAGVFGVHGELKCDPTSAGRIVFSAGAQLLCRRGEDRDAIRLAAVRPHGNRLLIRIEGVDDASRAGDYAGASLYAGRERIALSEGEYLDEDLVGCRVLGKDGTPYGAVQRVEHYPASDMLIVDGAMVPMVRSIVCEIEVAGRRIVIDPPLGLFEKS
ncbi:MAG: 16S rRNA processing protein RimM [Candidatus Eremiobacteraeota bacterium]|nr:16S rRNA processing protein RimM [Candidatus Eremiobacteraeota bacterium]